tara:strand:- start:191247 stop:191900 length:654 start_codon:yes stop_codon:yes gene_type:complete
MKKYDINLVIFLCSIILFLPVESNAVQDNEYIHERIRENTKYVHGVIDYNAVLVTLKNDIRVFGVEPMGFDPVRDSIGIAKVMELDLERLQKEAVKPYFDYMCELLNAEDADLVKIVELFNQAKSAEAYATEQAYFSVTSHFISDGLEIIENLKDELAKNLTSMEIDWVGVARDVPEYAKQHFERTCENYSNPGANRIDKSTIEMLNENSGDGFYRM